MTEYRFRTEDVVFTLIRIHIKWNTLLWLFISVRVTGMWLSVNVTALDKANTRHARCLPGCLIQNLCSLHR